MKLIRVFLVGGILLLTFVFGLNAQIIDKPLVSVRLTRPELITRHRLDIKRILFENRTGTKVSDTLEKQLLESMISERLILQSAEEKSIVVSDIEVEARVSQMRIVNGSEISEDTFLKLVETQLGIAYYEFRDEIKNELILQKYLLAEKRIIFESIRLPSATEIENFYEQNIQRYIQPEAVRLSQIFFDTTQLSSEGKLEKRQKAMRVSEEIQNGTGAFENLILLYSDDLLAKQKNGDVGYLFRNDITAKTQLGEEFFDTAFQLEIGEISQVVTSPHGYHLLQATDKLPKKILSLTDYIHPFSSITVKDSISGSMLSQRQAAAFETALREVDTELRSEAEIRYF